MNSGLIALQIAVGALLTISVLLQRGQAGLGTVFGGSISEGYRTRRGFEAFLYNFTIFLSVIFVANSIAIIIISA